MRAAGKKQFCLYIFCAHQPAVKGSKQLWFQSTVKLGSASTNMTRSRHLLIRFLLGCPMGLLTWCPSTLQTIKEVIAASTLQTETAMGAQTYLPKVPLEEPEMRATSKDVPSKPQSVCIPVGLLPKVLSTQEIKSMWF